MKQPELIITEDAEIAAIRAEIELLTTKLALMCQRKQLRDQVRELSNLSATTDEDKCAEIIRAVCAEFKLPSSQIFSKRRPKNIVEPRQIAMFLAIELTELTFEKIGAIFQKDHSTVSHAHDAITNKCQTEPDFRARVDRIRMNAETRIKIHESENTITTPADGPAALAGLQP